eukprot:450755-Pelagomonas_calceolata.AAC.15
MSLPAVSRLSRFCALRCASQPQHILEVSAAALHLQHQGPGCVWGPDAPSCSFSSSSHNAQNSALRAVFLGPPGVGKGTYASRIANHFGLPHIATGDLIREEIKNKTDMGLQVCCKLRRVQQDRNGMKECLRAKIACSHASSACAACSVLNIHSQTCMHCSWSYILRFSFAWSFPLRKLTPELRLQMHPL